MQYILFFLRNCYLLGRRCGSLGLLVGLWQLPLIAHAQTAPDWQMALGATQAPRSINDSFITGSAADAAGNVYVVGYFQGRFSLGKVQVVGTGYPDVDVFVAKWSAASRRFEWAQRIGGATPEYAYAIAVSGTGVYVAGQFIGKCSVGPVTLTSAGGWDVFVAKLTTTGQVAWAQRGGGTGSDEVKCLAVEGDAVYVGGQFAGSATYGASSLTAAGDNDGFVAKLTDAGTSAAFAWAQQVGGAADDVVNAVAVQGPNVYMAGNFSSPVATCGPSSLTNAGGTDIFVVKLTDAGSTSAVGWAQQAGGPGQDEATAVAVAGQQVYVVGNTAGGPSTFGSNLIANNDTTGSTVDLYVAKLTDAGTTGRFVWAQSAGGEGNDSVSALTVRGTSIYLVGSTGVGGLELLFGAAYLTKLTDAGSKGTYNWSQQVGGDGLESPNTVVVSGTQVYVAGAFYTTAVNFGATTLTCPTNMGAAFLTALTDKP